MKAQISAQVFIYLGAAVIAGLILIFGFKAIGTITRVFSETNIDDFVSDFTNDVERISKQSDSVSKFEHDLPDVFDTVCFIDSLQDNGEFGFSPGIIDNPFIRNKVQNDVEENVFLLREGEVEEAFYVEDMDVRANYLCVENEGLITVWMKGTGKKTELYTGP